MQRLAISDHALCNSEGLLNLHLVDDHWISSLQVFLQANQITASLISIMLIMATSDYIHTSGMAGLWSIYNPLGKGYLILVDQAEVCA